MKDMISKGWRVERAKRNEKDDGWILFLTQTRFYFESVSIWHKEIVERKRIIKAKIILSDCCLASCSDHEFVGKFSSLGHKLLVDELHLEEFRKISVDKTKRVFCQESI